MPRRRLKRNINRKQNVPKVETTSTEPSATSAGLDFLSSFDNVSICDATAAVPDAAAPVSDTTVQPPPVPPTIISLVSKVSRMNAAAAPAAVEPGDLKVGAEKPETLEGKHAKTPVTDGDTPVSLGDGDEADMDDDDYDEQEERTPNAVAMKSYFAGDKWKQETTTRPFTTWTSDEVIFGRTIYGTEISLCTDV